MIPTKQASGTARWLLIDAVITRSQGKLVPIPRAEVTATHDGRLVRLFAHRTGDELLPNPLHVGPQGIVRAYILGRVEYVDLKEVAPTGERGRWRFFRP
jgi:hypothetical protein